MVHLCGRPLPSKGRSVMGRETAIQKVRWTSDGWLRLSSGGHTAEILVDAPGLEEHMEEKSLVRDDFDRPELDINYQTLRIPLDESMMSLTERKGYLRLYGHESLSSRFRQSFVARRQQSFIFRAETSLEFEPENFQQMAGLTCFYDTTNYIYLYVSRDEEKGKIINLMINDLNLFTYPLEEEIEIPETGKVYLRAEVYYDMASFYYSLDAITWNPVGGYVEYSKLSDEYFKERKMERFTGAFVGICCQDFTGKHLCADFDHFDYEEGD